jgi:hypothetical protein
MQRILAITFILAALGCPLTAREVIGRDADALGTFLANDMDFSRSLTTRSADHRFVTYRFQVLDYAKPPAIAVVLRGTWDLKARKYCETVTECSYSGWRSLIGRTRCYSLSSLTPDALQYISSDSAPIRERQLGEREAASRLRNPFSFVSRTVRQKYGFRRYQ